MNWKKILLVTVVAAGLAGCGVKPLSSEKAVLTIDEYQVTAKEFEDGFAASLYADRPDHKQARTEYMENLVNRKLILLDAQRRGLDKDQEFLRSVERFWEQSLMTAALGAKTRDIAKGLTLSEKDLRQFYENMVKEGITTKSYDEVYPQIKWQAQKQMESRLLDEWMKDLKVHARVEIDKSVLKGE